MSQPITIDGNAAAVTIKHDASKTITIASQPGAPFLGLVVKDDDGLVLFRAPNGPKNKMWHVEIQ